MCQSTANRLCKSADFRQAWPIHILGCRLHRASTVNMVFAGNMVNMSVGANMESGTVEAWEGYICAAGIPQEVGRGRDFASLVIHARHAETDAGDAQRHVELVCR